MDNNKIIRFSIPFKTKNHKNKIVQKEKKGFFEGEFIVVMDLETEIIVDVKLKIEELGIDVFNTCSWFPKNKFKNKKIFKIRKKLLNKVKHNLNPKARFWKKGCMRNDVQICNSFHKDLIQKPENEIKHLSKKNPNDIDKLKQLENDFNNNKLSFRSIDAIATGSNPSGTILKPEANSVVLNTKNKIFNKKYHNFSFIFQKSRINKKVTFDSKEFLDKKIFNFLEIKNKIIPILEKIFKFSNKLAQESKKIELIKIKNKAKKEKSFLNNYNCKDYNKIISSIGKKRNRFRKEIDKTLIKKPFIKKNITAYDRAHLKGVQYIVKEALDKYFIYKEFNSEIKILLDQISNINNGAFLRKDYHSYYDQGKSYIDWNDGKMYFNKKYDQNPILVIKKECLNKERIKFIKYHYNKIWDKKK